MAKRKNWRRAAVGRAIIQGAPRTEAMLALGYAPSTAYSAHNGTSGDYVQAAVDYDPASVPENLVQTARSTLARRLRQLESPQALLKVKVGELARLLDVLEKSYGTRAIGGPGGPDLRTMDARLAWLQQAISEYRERIKVETSARELRELQAAPELDAQAAPTPTEERKSSETKLTQSLLSDPEPAKSE